MDSTRRGLLKLLGAGTTIVPVLKGRPIIEAAAQLIEVPKVELVNDFIDNMGPSAEFHGSNVYNMIVTFLDENGKKCAMMAPKSFIYNFTTEWIDPIYGRLGDFAYHSRGLKWKMEGELAEDRSGELVNLYYEH